MGITREPQKMDVTISNTLANCTVIPKHLMAAGSLALQASTSLATISVYASHDGTNFGPVYDRYGNAITVVVTSGSEMVFPELPDIVYKYPFLKLKDSGNEETATLFLVS